jgi:hypothetical protein
MLAGITLHSGNHYVLRIGQHVYNDLKADKLRYHNNATDGRPNSFIYCHA